MSGVSWLDGYFYPEYEDNWDDALFRKQILKSVRSDQRMLDLGAGAGIVSAMNFRGRVKWVCGIDLDPRVLSNPHLDEAAVASITDLPYSDDSFDLVISDNVMEHIEEPELVFKEIYRVLKPGGMFLFKTPNRLHYMPIIARLTPYRFHQWVNRKRGREAEDTFVTHYKCNSEKQVKALTRMSRLKIKNLLLVEGRPEYLRINVFLYLLGVIYERIVNMGPCLRNHRILLMAEIIKPS